MAFPTNAKMIAFVWRGRILPNVVYCRSKLKIGYTSWMAAVNPTNIPTSPNITVAIMKAFTILLS
jgi:hypothetical protein